MRRDVVMDGVRAEIDDAEKVGCATAAGRIRRKYARASTSFSLGESRWLHEVMVAVLTRNQHRVRELSGDPTGYAVAQKVLGVKRKAESCSEPMP